MAKQHNVNTLFTQGMRFESLVSGHTLVIDAEDEFGGNDAGPRPKPLILSSLAGCTGMDVVSLLNKMRVNFSDFNIETTADLSEDHPKVYTRIYLTYHIKVKAEDEDKVKKAVDLSQERYCGVSAMLSKVCPIDVKINFI